MLLLAAMACPDILTVLCSYCNVRHNFTCSHTRLYLSLQKALGQKLEASVGVQPLVNQLSEVIAETCTTATLQEAGDVFLCALSMLCSRLQLRSLL